MDWDEGFVSVPCDWESWKCVYTMPNTFLRSSTSFFHLGIIMLNGMNFKFYDESQCVLSVPLLLQVIHLWHGSVFDYINTGCRHDAQPCILDFYSHLFVFSLAVPEPGNLYSSSSYLLWPQPMRDIYFAYHTLPPSLPMVWKNMHCPLLGWEWGREIHFFVTSTAKGHKIFVFFF